MNRMRTWSLGAAGVAVLVALAGWFLLISPAKAKVTDLHTQTAAQQQANQALQTQIAQLKVQQKGLPQQQAKLAKVRQHLPATPALPTYVRTLTVIAQKADVKLITITPSVPTAVAVAAPVVTAAPTPSASASSESATGDAVAAPAVAPVAVSPLRMIPVGISVSGTYTNVTLFLTKVEALQRSMLVYSIDLKPGGSGPVAPSASASAPSTPTSVDKVTAVLQTRIFYSPPVVATATTPATGAASAVSGSAAPATVS
jgi:Tfp pilus assembly protein PilO